jgi:predicted nucleic acid-binding protein
LIIVDTSAWRREPIAHVVDELLEENRVALCGPIVTELRRGLRSAAERRKVLPLLGGCRHLAQPERLWEEADDLGFSLRRSGYSVKTLDMLIAVHALAIGVPILTLDTDFEHMRKAGVPLHLVA